MKEFRLCFLSQVENDIRAATLWYEEKAPGLGLEFRRVFFARAEEISRCPRLYREVYGEFRRCLLRRFPYAMYFRIEEDRVIVFGVFHSARDPEMISTNLENRS